MDKEAQDGFSNLRSVETSILNISSTSFMTGAKFSALDKPTFCAIIN